MHEHTDINAITQQANTLLEKARTDLASGRQQQAAEAADAITALQPDHAEAWLIRGIVYAQQQDLRQACDCFRKAVSYNPDYVPALINLGNACLGIAATDEAEAAFNSALALQPGNPDVLGGLAETLNRSGRHSEALATAEAGLKPTPEHLHCRLTLAGALAGLGRDDEAGQHYQKLLQQYPNLLVAHARFAQLCLRRGNIDTAVEHQRTAVRLVPSDPRQLCSLASGLQLQGHLEEALAVCDQALALAPSLPAAISRQASILERQGNFEAAMAKLEPLLKCEQPDPGAVLAYARLSPHMGRTAEGIALLEEQLAGNWLSEARQDKVHKLLAKLYDSSDDYKRAFAHNSRAHALRKARFNPDAHDAHVNQIIASQDTAALESVCGKGDLSERPVFIVGMPRSGTSLVEQILASHPDVYGAGELSNLPELAASLASITDSGSHYPTRLATADRVQIQAHARRYLERLAQLNPDALRVTDKLPHNFLYLGVIQTLFPNARVIHIHRDPLDTCLSCHLQDFSSAHAYAYDLKHLGRYYLAYARIMDHWRQTLRMPLLEISYEHLVANLEGGSRELIKFCDLSWNDRCLRFHETRRTVTTPSYEQVRCPIYASSVGRWHHYDEWLGPLIETLGPSNKTI